MKSWEWHTKNGNAKTSISSYLSAPLVPEAEKYKAEDASNWASIESKNDSENYCFQLRNTMNEETFCAKLSSTVGQTIQQLWIKNEYTLLITYVNLAQNKITTTLYLFNLLID